MTFDDYLKEVRARLEAATPGPWNAYDWPSFPRKDEAVSCVRIESKTTIMAFCFAGTPNHDALFIANAPTDIARLLQAVEVLREAIYKIHTNSALTFLEATKFAGMSGLSRDTFMKAHMGHLDFLRDKALAKLDEIMGEK